MLASYSKQHPYTALSGAASEKKALTFYNCRGKLLLQLVYLLIHKARIIVEMSLLGTIISPDMGTIYAISRISCSFIMIILTLSCYLITYHACQYYIHNRPKLMHHFNFERLEFSSI